MSLCASDFDYPLDPALIAQEPLSNREHSRLMVLRRPGGQVSHHVFAELPSLLRRGDVLVLNDTQVVPARFDCRRATGGKIEGLFLNEPAAGQWEAMLKNAGRCAVGETLAVEGDDGIRLRLAENLGEGRWRLACEPPCPAAEVLQRVGFTPLPPYIHRQPQDDPQDRARYQTVYASRAGAVAAPTAGLHFTQALLERLAQAGIETCRVTLHVGLGTFLPVKAENLAEHPMHSEWYDLSAESARQINQARRQGRRIVAVGTTSVRVLETVASQGPEGADLPAASGQTRLFLYPPARFRVVDALITNFHLPKSTLLMLVSAFCAPGSAAGIDMIRHAYETAQQHRYRFFSYGDAMLIE